MIGLSSFLSAEFTKVGNVVTDSKTGLVWQDNDDANGTQRTWQEAIDYCEALSLDTYEDWRLPNINELKSIVDRSKSNLAIADGFTNTSSSNYWSSTSLLGNEDGAWIVYFDDGSVFGLPKDGSFYVRCVRDGQ